MFGAFRIPRKYEIESEGERCLIISVSTSDVESCAKSLDFNVERRGRRTTSIIYMVSLWNDDQKVDYLEICLFYFTPLCNNVRYSCCLRAYIMLLKVYATAALDILPKVLTNRWKSAKCNALQN